jgi:uncharacterized membrane protein
MATAGRSGQQQVNQMDQSQESIKRTDRFRDQQSRGRRSRAVQSRDRLQRGGLLKMDEQKLARGLGWFSIGLGIAEVAAPHAIAKFLGVREDRRGLIRLLGLREIGSGVGILSQRRPAEGVWSRVGGDALDLGLLTAAFLSPNSNKTRVAAATAAVMGVTALDVMTAAQLSRSTHRGDIPVKESIIINRSPEEVYQFWREVENLPRFMYHLESVKVIDRNRSHWIAKGPLGARVEWDAEVTEERPNELIAWRSLPDSDIDNSGLVRFESAPGGRGTVVTAVIRYSPPGGALGATVAKLLGREPGQQVRDDLRRFKQIMEVGEVVQSDASIHSMPHSAQPPEELPARARSATAGRPRS